MIEIPGRIPISIHPFFWLLAGLIGWMNSGGSVLLIFIWVAVILVSVLFHELGHALTSVIFKQKAKIQLIAFGGATSYEGPKLKFWQQFLIVLNGPVFGFTLFLLASFILSHYTIASPALHLALRITKLANLFWTIVNLLPIIPLDGGQLLRIALEAAFGLKGFKAALLIGACISGALAFYFFIMHIFIAGALFFLFAFQSFDLWRNSRHITKDDRDDENRNLIIRGEILLREGKANEAENLFSQVLEKVKSGVLATAARQYLALLKMRQGKKDEAYELLLPVEEDLSDETKPILHELSESKENHQVIVNLSKESFQIAPSQKVALRNARAFAALGQAKAAGGWLQTAWKFGKLDLDRVLEEECFLKIKDCPEFQSFVKKLS